MPACSSPSARSSRASSKGEEGHLKKAGAPPLRHLVEFRDEDLGSEEGPKIGDDVTVEGFEAARR